jgi:GAF domain-containing protein
MPEDDAAHRQVATLLTIAQLLNGVEDQRKLLNRILDALCSGLGYKGATLRMLDLEGQRLALTASAGVSARYLAKGEVDLPHSPIDRLVFAGQNVAFANLATEAGMQYPAEALDEGLIAVLAVPIRVGNRVVGVLRAYYGEPHSFGGEEQTFLSGVADLVARSLAATQRHRAFAAIARRVNGSLVAQDVLKELLRSLVQELNVKAGVVRLVGPKRERLHVAASEGLSQAYLEKGDIRITESPLDQQVLTADQPVMLYDIAAQPGLQYPQEALAEGIRSILAVPLRLHGELIGVLRVYSAQPHRFGEEETELVQTVADLAAIALENARLHQSLEEKYRAANQDWSGWYRYLAMS